jgi:hypothetical protein
MRQLIITLFCCSSFLLNAQKSTFSPTEIGLKFGLYSSTIFPEHNYGSGLNEYSFTPGNTIGISLGWELKNKNFIVLDAEWSKQGQKHEDWKVENDPAYYFQKNVDLEYVRFPFYYKNIINLKKKNFEVYWLAGLYGAYLSKADITYIRGGEIVDFATAMTAKNEYADAIYQPSSLKDLFQWFDFGLVVGGGIQTLVNDKILISCDIRIESGISDINDNDWQFPHAANGYKASRNYLLGLKGGVAYRF